MFYYVLSFVLFDWSCFVFMWPMHFSAELIFFFFFIAHDLTVSYGQVQSWLGSFEVSQCQVTVARPWPRRLMECSHIICPLLERCEMWHTAVSWITWQGLQRYVNHRQCCHKCWHTSQLFWLWLIWYQCKTFCDCTWHLSHQELFFFDDHPWIQNYERQISN